MSNAPSKPVSFSRPKVGYFSNRPRIKIKLRKSASFWLLLYEFLLSSVLYVSIKLLHIFLLNLITAPLRYTFEYGMKLNSSHKNSFSVGKLSFEIEKL